MSDQNIQNSKGTRDTLAAGLVLLSMCSFGSSAREEALATELATVPAVARTLDAEQTVASGRAERIELSEAGKAWIEREVQIVENTRAGEGAPRLIDGTTFLTPEMAAVLAIFVGESNGEITFKSIDHEGYKFAFETAEGEIWYVSECPHYRDQFPNGIPFNQNSLEIWKRGSEKLIQKEFSAPAVFNLRTGEINFASIATVVDKAEAIRASEIRDGAGVRDIELTDRPIGYIGLVDGNPNDPIMAGSIEDTKYFAELLNSLTNEAGEKLYNLVAVDGSEAIAVEQSPYQLLRSNVQKLYDQGVRDFYLNFAGHGNEHGIYFAHGWQHFRLSPEQVHAVFNEFKDCTFTVDTIACYGGGLAEAMKDYEDPTGEEGRIFMKLQAKPYSYNQEGRLVGEEGVNGQPAVHSSYYQIFNAYFLLQGMSFGEAHYQADLAAKQLIPCDAEGWVSGIDGGTATLREG